MTLDDPTIMSNLSVENMDARRWEWVCSICGLSGEDGSAGACVRCDAGGCRNAMHVTCAQDWQLMEMDESDLESGMSNPFFIVRRQTVVKIVTDFSSSANSTARHRTDFDSMPGHDGLQTAIIS